MKNIPSHRWSDKQAASSQKQVVYRVKNWAVYNESLVQRGSLTVWLSQEAIDGWRYTGPSPHGAQFLYSDQAIETALTLRKLFGLALRQTEGFVPSLLSMLDLDLSAPNDSTLSRRHPGLQVDLPVKPTHKRRRWWPLARRGNGMGMGVAGEATGLDPAAHLAQTACGLRCPHR